MDISFAPMGFRDEARQVAGADVELARLLSAALGVEVELVNMDFDALFPALESGEIDVAMSAITVNEERQSQHLFVEYMQSGSAILVQEGNPLSIEYPANFCGHTVGVQEGTVQEQFIEDFTCH